jgi:hypothetical protein
MRAYVSQVKSREGVSPSVKYRSARKHERVCAWCGETFQAPRPSSKACSRECSSKLGSRGVTKKAIAKGPKMVSCIRCGIEFEGGTKRKYCSATCRKESRGSWPARSPLRSALESGDHSGVIAAIRLSVVVDDEGCWVWQRTKKKGYGQVVIAGKSLQVHRLALEAKLGRPLGSQQSHHVCANTSCVNPDHLQPATYAENIAEMKARRSYIDRIRELEEALKESDPDHPLLVVAEYALVG